MHVLPCTFVVEEPVGALLKLLGDVLRLLMSLEPGLVLLVEAPALVLEGLGSEVLLVGPLSVVEKIEESIGVDSTSIVQPRVIKYR